LIDMGVGILLALRAGPLDLAELQVATGLPRATAHRLVVALEQHHLVRRDAQGRFCLGFELVALGRVAGEQFPMAELATPVLHELRERCGESVQLYVREDDARRCVVSLQSPHGLRWIVPEGSVLPLGVGSAGRLLLGESTTGEWVESVAEREPGVASVSAPVRDRRGAVIAAVSVSGPIERMSTAPGERFGLEVAAAGRDIGRLLDAR
jgi:DNA-binding IclR family transcriptional regulator